MATEIRVVIAAAGRPDLLKRTLTSLAACVQPEAYRETVVVENGPPAGLEQIVNEADARLCARYEYVSWANKSNALNLVLSQCNDSCLIVFTDDDCRFDKNLICEYASASAGVDRGVFWGGSMGADYDETPASWIVPFLPVDAREFGVEEYERGSRYLVFLGCNWAAFTGDLRRAGGFDTDSGPGGTSGSIGQESDMQQRLLEIGVVPQFIPQAKVWHYVPQQRCSPQWIASRHYRFGILDAMTRGQRPTNRLRLPLWQWRRVARQACRYLVTRLHPNVAKRFDAKLKLYCEMGMARGVWLLARDHNSESV